MGRPRLDTRKQDTRQRLLDAAEQEFARVGFEAARLQDIARAAEISRPSLLYHFDTKDSLYRAVVLAVFQRLVQALSDAMATAGDFAARLDATVFGYLAFIEANPHIARIVLREVVDGRGPGRALLMEQAVPVLQLIDDFVKRHAGKLLRRGLPVREAVLQIAFTAMVRAAAGELREPLFGTRDHTAALARYLFLQE